MALWWTLMLAAVFTVPSCLYLWPAGYDMAGAAHLVTFLAAVILLTRVGRGARKQERRPSRTGLAVGAAAGALGALGSAAVSHSVPANTAFLAYLAQRGVPAPAAATLHALYAAPTALLTALIAAVFYGVVGAFAAWWGAKPWRRLPPQLKEDPST